MTGVAFAIGACLSVGAAQADVGGPEIVGYVNAQRAAQGIPAGITEDASLSDGCARHNAYGRQNGSLGHSEDPSQPGYSPEGDQAAQTSVLYSGSGPWTATHNPFETAPIHLHQLLAPRLDRMGASENQGWGCATTLASRNRPAPSGDVTYTYPGGGATGWPASQVASEGPYTPGERVGIPAGTRTGPYLYVMFDGPDMAPFDTATATGATLTGPSGPVDVAVVDNHTSGLENYLPTGLEIIPRSPLAAGATYTASVGAFVTSQNGNGPSRSFTHSWSFTTATGGGVDAPASSASGTGSPSESGTSTQIGGGFDDGDGSSARKPRARKVSAQLRWTSVHTTATGRLVGRAQISRLANGGRLGVVLRGNGRTSRFGVVIRAGRIRIDRKLPSRIARARTIRAKLSYAGNNRVRSASTTVTLR